jgi:hypothetical protein
MSGCFCIGPQNGEPLCPCRMRSVEIKDGRYVQVIDHGPVKEPIPESYRKFWDNYDDYGH